MNRRSLRVAGKLVSSTSSINSERYMCYHCSEESYKVPPPILVLRMDIPRVWKLGLFKGQEHGLFVNCPRGRNLLGANGSLLSNIMVQGQVMLIFRGNQFHLMQFAGFTCPFIDSNRLRDSGFLSFPQLSFRLVSLNVMEIILLFVKESDGNFLVVLVYVDDILIASTNDSATSDLKSHLNSVFKLRDLGSPKNFPDLEIAQSAAGISI